MANRYASAVQYGTCKGCGTEQPLAACRDPACPSNDPWIEVDAYIATGGAHSTSTLNNAGNARPNKQPKGNNNG